MRLNTLKKIMFGSAFGLLALVGTSQVTNAQSRDRDRNRDRDRYERRDDRNDRRDDRRAEQNRNNNDRWRVNRGGRYYNTDSRGAELLRQAVNQGYQQGFREGQRDRSSRRRGSYNNSSIYQRGNYGYQNHVDSAQYRYYFQQGFQRGYQDGYNSRNRYGQNNNGSISILGSILNGILNLQRY
jgi:flagellar biosynthesis/type III secretory pathway protein FliH